MKLNSELTQSSKNKLSIRTFASVTSAFNAAKYDQTRDSFLVYGLFILSEALKEHLLNTRRMMQYKFVIFFLLIIYIFSAIYEDIKTY